ncbi:MAG: Fe-S oxidoreductase [Myxococcota bacterium]|jgi:Fe-S oxidoreductase
MSKRSGKTPERPAKAALGNLEAALSLCTYCPSLCQNACPVATVQARHTVTPWALMSLADHVRRGRVELTERLSETLYQCSGCGACTDACLHDNDVAETLVAVRAVAVAQGRAAFTRSLFSHADLPSGGLTTNTIDAEGKRVPADPLGSIRGDERYEESPALSLLPGRVALDMAAIDGGAAETLLALCATLDQEALSAGRAARMDLGYELWFSGHHDAFQAQARVVAEALVDTRGLVVMSPQELYLLREVYPRFGVSVDATLIHTSEFLLPLLSGAVIERLPGSYAYHDSCYLTRNLNLDDTPREVLARVLESPLIELPYRRSTTQCCGGTGCLPTTAPATSEAMAGSVVDLAIAAGAEHLISFSPECVAVMQRAAGDRLRVEHAVTVVARAVVGDGAAG